MSYEIHFTQTAVRDLNEAIDYIDHVLLNPDASDHLLANIEQALDRLSAFPEAHAIVDDPFFKTHKIRFVMIKNYLAFYVIDHDKQVVHILRFLYGKRNWISVLKHGFSID
ncbi:MAG: type II toxin-antitoxin system RelE/ParE family toxin [Lachnospiraceae bacterium]|nr:type II toxin-antitoxin system RelE/ParE family toxin [Lachnospiraceae bacterium]